MTMRQRQQEYCDYDESIVQCALQMLSPCPKWPPVSTTITNGMYLRPKTKLPFSLD